MPDNSEGRAPRREALTILVQIKRETDPVGTMSRSVNLSITGMLVETELNLSIGEMVHLRFIVPKTTHTVFTRGCVIREAHARGVRTFGIGFVDPKANDVDIIR